MRALVRMLLLSLVALCLALPLAGGIGARVDAEAASRPCPSKAVLKACVPQMTKDAVAPRGAAVTDGQCLGKAIGVESPALAVPALCGALAYETASASWSAWAPPTPAPPPRS